MNSRIYLPDIVGAGYAKYWRDRERYRVLKGGKGSKKSTTTALNFIWRLMKYPKSNLLVVRRVMDTHRDSTFAQLRWAQERLGVSHLWRSTVSPMEMVYLPTGQKILFRGFDNVLKLASTTVTDGYLNFVWIEEAFEIESEADFDKLDLSVPRGEVPPPLFKQTTLTFNPWNEAHWLKARFFDKSQPGVSVYTTNYLINEWLDDTDRAVFERMKTENPRKYAVSGLGEWGVSDGLVYENWERRDFCVKELGLKKLPDGKTADERWKYRCFFGLDYGYTNDPTAFIAFAANPVDKQIYIFDEHYETHMLNCDIADMIRRKGYAKERIRADAAEPKSNDDLRRLGISRLLPSVKGPDSIMNGIAKIQEYRIFVHPACKNTLAELSGYCFRKDRNTGKILNEPEDRNNHLMDALRYAFYDVQYFHAVSPRETAERKRSAAGRSGEISGSDLKGGGWI